MLRAESRVRKETDKRLTSQITRTAVGWYCRYCQSVKPLFSGVREELPLSFEHQTIDKNMVLTTTVQQTVQDQTHSV
jgi:hypothetical protein